MTIIRQSRWAVGFLGMAVIAAVSLRAAEHPKEHPTSEHPKEHPKEKGQEHPSTKATDKETIKKEFSATVKAHIDKQSQANNGAFVVNDNVLKKNWALKLVRIHEDKIVSLADAKFFACADFMETGAGTTKLDLDFYVSKVGGNWVVDKVLVHKVNDKPRYTYNDKNEMVPVTQ